MRQQSRTFILKVSPSVFRFFLPSFFLSVSLCPPKTICRCCLILAGKFIALSISFSRAQGKLISFFLSPRTLLLMGLACSLQVYYQTPRHNCTNPFVPLDEFFTFKFRMQIHLGETDIWGAINKRAAAAGETHFIRLPRKKGNWRKRWATYAQIRKENLSLNDACHQFVAIKSKRT